MSDEPQNPISTENPIPPSPQEPTLDAPIPPADPELTPSVPVAPEAPMEAESAIPVNIDNGEISIPEAENPAPEQTAPSSAEGYERAQQIEEVEENKLVSEVTTQPTAQMAGNEPLAEPETKNYQPESKSQIPIETYKNRTHENLTKAQLTIQEKKRKKLEKIIEALNTKGRITNDEVEKLLHVSDATATRYLSILEKEGKIKQEGRTGQSVSYSRI